MWHFFILLVQDDVPPRGYNGSPGRTLEVFEKTRGIERNHRDWVGAEGPCECVFKDRRLYLAGKTDARKELVRSHRDKRMA